jgi:hypothetical protein
MPMDYRVEVNRSLTTQEFELLEWLVAHGGPSSQAFAPQLQGVSVCGTCGCGCPTIDLKIADDLPSIKPEARLIADFLADVRDSRVGVLLFQRDGRLSMLEIYSFGDNPTPFDLPSVADVYPWEDLSQRP